MTPTMILIKRTASILALVAAAGILACRSAPDVVQRTHARADVEFVQDMIVHHGQALEMTRLVPDRSQNAAVRHIAARIEISQTDEMAQMRRWLRKHNEPERRADGHHGHMPGMASAEDMARLAAASGEDFDRLFFRLMIEHHQGALTMLDRLQAAGGGMEPEMFQLASHIDADQRAEIARMRRILTDLSQ